MAYPKNRDVTVDDVVPEEKNGEALVEETHQALSMGGNMTHMTFSAFKSWPTWAQDCVKGRYGCKPPADYGGCMNCKPGWIYGKTVSCSEHYGGDSCDFGPVTCGKGRKTCFEPKIKKGIRDDKSLILTAIELATLAYRPKKEEDHCPGLSKRMKLKREIFKDFHTRVAFGVAHGSAKTQQERSDGTSSGLYTVAFRGTEMNVDADTTVGNWLTNLKLYSQTLDGHIIHKGFYDALAGHTARLFKSMEAEDAMANHDRLLITGHSLGGALATLFAYFAKHKYPDMEIELITVGAPRVGDTSFATALEDRCSLIYRVAARCDPIPRTPETIWHSLTQPAVQMVHAGPQITVGSKNSCWDDPMKTLSAEEHNCDLYISRVRHEIEGPPDGSDPSGTICPEMYNKTVPEYVTELFSFEKALDEDAVSDGKLTVSSIDQEIMKPLKVLKHDVTAPLKDLKKEVKETIESNPVQHLLSLKKLNADTSVSADGTIVISMEESAESN